MNIPDVKPPNRNPLAIAIAVIGLMTQVAMWGWWGGRFEQRVADIEKHQNEADRKITDLATGAGQQTTATAVVVQELTDIKATVDRIDRKTDVSVVTGKSR